MEGKRITDIYCGSTFLSRVVGWYQLVAAVLLALPGSGFLLRVAVISEWEHACSHDTTGIVGGSGSESIENGGDTGGSVYCMVANHLSIFIATELVIGILRGSMASLLLHATYTKNVKIMTAWIVYAIVGLVLHAVVSFVMPLFYIRSIDSINTMDNVYIPVFFVDIFCVWVVHTHRTNEMKSSLTSRQEFLDSIYTDPKNHIIDSVLVKKAFIANV